MPEHTTADQTRRCDVELRLPADGAFVSLLRTASSGLAARLDFTIDDIEDVRMAVSEACALVLPQAAEGSDLLAQFFLAPDTLTVQVSVPARDAMPPDRSTLGWQVLSALADDVEARNDNGRYTVSMTMLSALS